MRNKRPSNPIDEKRMSQQKTKDKEKRKGNERKKKVCWTHTKALMMKPLVL